MLTHYYIMHAHEALVLSVFFEKQKWEVVQAAHPADLPFPEFVNRMELFHQLVRTNAFGRANYGYIGAARATGH